MVLLLRYSKVSYQCIYFLLVNPGSFPKLANVGLPLNNPPLEQYTIEPPLRLIEPSNSLCLIEVRLLL